MKENFYEGILPDFALGYRCDNARYLYKSRIECCKFAECSKFIKNLCWDMNLKLDIEINKGWIRETIYFTVEGTREEIEEFKYLLKVAIEDYKERIK